MTELEKIQSMTVDEMTTSLVRILTCKRCFCYELCNELKASHGADKKAPCTVAIKMFLESEVTE